MDLAPQMSFLLWFWYHYGMLLLADDPYRVCWYIYAFLVSMLLCDGNTMSALHWL
jgi:hypothetical protein